MPTQVRHRNVFRQDSEIHLKSLETLWKFNSFTQLCSTYLQMKQFPSKSEKTVFAANAKSFQCMQEARENGQNVKTSGSNSPPLSNASPHGRLRTSPTPWRRLEVKFPGFARGEGMLKFRIDRYINEHVFNFFKITSVSF